MIHDDLDQARRLIDHEPKQIEARELTHLCKLLNFFLILSVVLAAYIGARMPNQWSMNYYMPSFFEGFYRRGLVGTILYPLGDLRFSQDFIHIFQIGVFIVLLMMGLRYAYQTTIAHKLLIILFFLAPTGGYLFHEIGYPEQLLYLVLIVALNIHVKWLALVMMMASLFIHEEALFTTIPIYFVYLLVNRASVKWLWIVLLGISSTFLILTFFLQTIDSNIIIDFMEKIKSKTDGMVHPFYYEIYINRYTTQAVTNRFLKLGGGWAVLPPRGHFSDLYFEIAVIVVFAALISRQFLSRSRDLVHNVFYFLSVWIAAISPLLMIFFGNDADRWVFQSFISSVFLFSLMKHRVSLGYTASILFIFLLFLAHGQLQYFDDSAPRNLKNDFYQVRNHWFG